MILLTSYNFLKNGIWKTNRTVWKNIDTLDKTTLQNLYMNIKRTWYQCQKQWNKFLFELFALPKSNLIYTLPQQIGNSFF